jgi:inhibitor of cysteine peptidase
MRWWKRSTGGVALGAIGLLLLPLEASGRRTADSNWAGRWNTTFTSMILTQKGNTVEGHYDWDNGHLTGTVKGRTLSGKWDEAPTRFGPDDAGSFVFTLAPDGKSFAGKWRNEGDKSWRGDWVGTCESGPCIRGSSAPGPAPAPTSAPRPVPIGSVANGCGDPGWRSVTGSRIHVANSAVFRVPSTGQAFTVDFKPACDLHDAGYRGAVVRDRLRGLTRDSRGWSRLRVDTQLRSDLRLLCRRAIPAAAVAALASCTSQGSDTASGAAARFAFVRSSGRALFDADPSAPGIQRAGPRAST